MYDLTAADYNYPTSNPTSVALWLLDTGLYRVGGTDSIRVSLTSSDTTAGYPGASFLVLNDIGASNRVFILRQISNTGPASYWLASSSGNRIVANDQLLSVSDIYADPSSKQSVRIGNTNPGGSMTIGIGYNAKPSSVERSIAIGHNTTSGYNGSIALGAGAQTTAVGEMNIGSAVTTYGYNSSNYRLLTGLYDGQSAHDAATVGQITPLSDTTAPTTATVGTLGKIYIDTTNGDAYMCVDASDPYVWKKITP